MSSPESIKPFASETDLVECGVNLFLHGPMEQPDLDKSYE